MYGDWEETRVLRRRTTTTAPPPGEHAGPASALRLDGVSREYRGGPRALDRVSLTLPHGRFLAVMGRSGSGKSTMLTCAAGLDRPTEGTVTLGGTDLSGLGEAARTRLRRDRVGFVFQELNLLPSLDVAENVALPLLLAGAEPTAALDRARGALAGVGLPDRWQDPPARLSGGQLQRVAVARALVTEPEVILADEPTGALDPLTADGMLRLLRETADTAGHAVLVVTHDPAAATWADETLILTRGRVTARLERPTPAGVRRELGR